jgi:mannosyltransferase OCH1-like enzyme
MRQLQKYSRWPKMQNNILRPIAYNSLTNMDLRKGNLNQIPKIIHQVWFKDEEIPESIQVLQSSI